MQRTISIMVGKGSVNHNRRKFVAQNVDAGRTQDNTEYCYTPIKKVYCELFNDALKRYNEKQTRADRKIDDYYEKIRSGKQEKPFHEIIVQIGNCDDMSSIGHDSYLAQKILDEYYYSFAERNPQLRVFSAHLHMDEATPHLHIDFIPFITESKRGLDTRVSLKQALAKQGFTAKGRGTTEWAMWVQSEKEHLATIMQRYGVEWEQKGGKEPHLSVLDYKKQQRKKEIEELNETLTVKKNEHKMLSEQIDNYTQGIESLQKMEELIEKSPDYKLPEPSALTTARAYKTKVAEPLFKKLKSLVEKALAKGLEGWNAYYRLNNVNGILYRENERLRCRNERLTAENAKLKDENRTYSLLKKMFGQKELDDFVRQSKEINGSEQRGKDLKNRDSER